MERTMEKSYTVELRDGGSKNEECTYRPMKWWSIYKQDIARYKKYRENWPLFIIWLTEQGLWALLQYRMASALYRSNIPIVVKAPLLALAAASQKLVEIVSGI